MTQNEHCVLEMLEEMNQIAHLAFKVKKIAEEIDELVMEANVATFEEMAKNHHKQGEEVGFSNAIAVVKEASVKVAAQLNVMIEEIRGLHNTNVVVKNSQQPQLQQQLQRKAQHV